MDKGGVRAIGRYYGRSCQVLRPEDSDEVRRRGLLSMRVVVETLEIVVQSLLSDLNAPNIGTRLPQCVPQEQSAHTLSA